MLAYWLVVQPGDRRSEPSGVLTYTRDGSPLTVMLLRDGGTALIGRN